MGLAHSPRIVTDGLVLCLDAANSRSYPKSGTTWSDLAGSNNGTLTNGPTFDSGNSGSIALDGTDDYITISANDFSVFSLTATQGVTVSAWVKMDSSTQHKIIFGAVGDGSHQMVLKYDDTQTPANTTCALADKFTFLILIPAGGKTSSTSCASSTTSPDGNWINVVGTRSGSGVCKIYINGVIETTSAGNAIAFNTPNNMYIGGDSSSSYEQSISSFLYYNRELTADEIRQNYNATRGRYGY